MAALQRALQTRDELIASVSHELRTPLNVILGWTATLQHRAADPERTREAVSILERNARVLWQLVEGPHRRVPHRQQRTRPAADGRRRSRCGGARQRRHPKPSAHAKRVTRNCTVDPDVPEVRGDEVRLQQVVWNLLWNALTRSRHSTPNRRPAQLCDPQESDWTVLKGALSIDFSNCPTPGATWFFPSK